MIQSICKKLTGHRWVRLWAYSEGLEPTEYHYKCRICHGTFWSYDAPTRQKDIKRLEAWRSEPDCYKNNSPTKPSDPCICGSEEVWILAKPMNGLGMRGYRPYDVEFKCDNCGLEASRHVWAKQEAEAVSLAIDAWNKMIDMHRLSDG